MGKSEELKESLKALNRGLAGAKKQLRTRLRKEVSFGIHKRINTIAAGVLAEDQAAREKRRQRSRGRAKESKTGTLQETEHPDRRRSDRIDSAVKTD